MYSEACAMCPRPCTLPPSGCRSALSRQSLHARGVDVAANLFGVTDVKVLLGIAEEDVLGIPVRVRVRVKGASEGEGEGEVEGEG